MADRRGRERRGGSSPGARGQVPGRRVSMRWAQRALRCVLMGMVSFATIAGYVAARPITAMATGGGDGCNPWNVDSSRQKNDYYHPRFVGQTVSDDSDYSGEVDEAKGAIYVYSPWVSEGLDGGTVQNYGGSDVSGWVMLAQAASKDTYVQAGWREFYQGHRYNFAEMDVPGQNQADWWFDPDPINTTHWWDVKFNRGYLNPTTQPMYEIQKDNGSWVWLKPPTADYQFLPDAAEFYTETHASADQEPGGYYNHDWMGYLNITSEKNTTLHVGSSIQFNNDWSANPPNGWYGLGTYTDNSFQMWDWACPY